MSGQRYYPDCTAALRALAEGLPPEACHNFRAVRELAACWAWHGEGTATMTPETFGQRLREGWDRVRSACASSGGITPEVGFLEPSEEPITYGIYAPDGRHVGVLTQVGDEVIACIHDRCSTAHGGAVSLDAVRTMLELDGYEVR